MPINITGAKLYLAAFTLAIWTAFFNLGASPFAPADGADPSQLYQGLQWSLPIIGSAPFPFLGVELTEVLRDFARRLSGKADETLDA